VNGSNTINNSTNVGKLNIIGGQINAFKSKVNVTGGISITGDARNDFGAELYSSGDIIIAGGVNMFSNLMTDGKRP
jgi:formylmethanofuran dehydrogenase subunit C